MYLAIEFCKVTKIQLETELKERFAYTDMDIIIKVLKNTQLFEKELINKFTIEKETGKYYELKTSLTEGSGIGSVEEIIAKYKTEKVEQ